MIAHTSMFKRMLPFALGFLAVACRWETDLPSDAKAIHVDPSRELLITNPSIVSGPLASNRERGPLSFRHAVSALPLPEDATLAWLDAWSRRLAEEGAPERARLFDEKITCRWLRVTTENHCDESCSSCASRHLAMDAAPFRLTAVVNRTDLSVMPDRAANGGEGRLLFALTDGPANDDASSALPFAVILEYAQAGSAREWTERWHALGSAPDFGAALTALTATFVASGALAQLRTADAWTGPMVFHQFELESGAIVPVNVRNTPDWATVTADSLRTFASGNATAIEEGTAVLPERWWASYSSPARVPPPWLAEVPQRDAIVRGTCAGCHARSASGFHVDPAAKGDQQASRFLVDPSRERDELRRRVEWMQLTLARPD